MANDRFEIDPGKSNWVRGFTLEGIVEFECHNSYTARTLLNALNESVSDVVVDRHLSFDVAPTVEWLPV